MQELSNERLLVIALCALHVDPNDAVPAKDCLTFLDILAQLHAIATSALH